MLNDFTVQRRPGGLVSSLDADRFDPSDEAGADPIDGGGDGSQPLDTDADLDASEDDRADTRQASGDGSGEDDDDDDDDVDARYEGLPADEQIKRLRAALKKNKRKLAKRTPVYQQVQEMVAQGLSLDDLKLSHRQYRLLSEQIQRNPRLNALVNGGGADDRTDRRDTARQPKDDDDFVFDDSPEALGFDPKESRTNQLLAERFKKAALTEHRLNKALERLNRLDPVLSRVDGIEQGLRRQSWQSVSQQWTDATEAAVKHITDPNPKRQNGLRTLFRDQMRMAMEKVGGKRKPSDIVTHYFNELGIDTKATARATAAAARTTQQTATRVQQLQRQPGQAGHPATARPQKRELLADVHKRMRTAGGAQVR